MSKYLRKYRKYLNISLRAAAAECGVSHATLANLEKKKSYTIKNKKKLKAVTLYYQKLESRVKRDAMGI